MSCREDCDRDFRDLVGTMREAQKTYFATKSPMSLGRAKGLEKQVDEMLARGLTHQRELFGDEPQARRNNP